MISLQNFDGDIKYINICMILSFYFSSIFIFESWPAVYGDLADAYGLFKVGGSDYHGRGGRNESELGSVNLPVLVLHDFLKVARPIWCDAIREIFESYAEEPSDSNLASIMRFGRTRVFNGGSPGKDLVDHCLPLWLTSEEMENAEFEAIKMKLYNTQGGIQVS